MPKNENSDINQIPYDAPLSFTEPPLTWKTAQFKKGERNSWETVPDADLHAKWVVISGSNTGIGLEAAIQFAKWGANIVLACRDPPPKEVHPTVAVEQCRTAARDNGHKDSQIQWWELDCAKLESVEAFAKRWLDTGRPLDILCNNAGIGSSPGGSEVFKTKNGFEIIHQVNLLSHVLLTLRLLPSIARAHAPRIVCTVSSGHYLGIFDLTNFNGEQGLAGIEGLNYYQNNKLWFQIWLAEMQRRFLQHKKYCHITINGVHPGCVKSGIWNLNSTGWLTTFKTLFIKATIIFKGITPQQGSLAILHAATNVDAGADPTFQGVGENGGKGGGRFFSRIWELTPMPHTQDADCRQRVWRKLNEELNLQEKGLLDDLGP
jgi:NAD(P)-dependent dehydrogenase (short-subunit alcohol dehydrogenase family)